MFWTKSFIAGMNYVFFLIALRFAGQITQQALTILLIGTIVIFGVLIVMED